jgi:murein DD-endopeptidase MepM/ murein hydrolase activator NlpD
MAPRHVLPLALLAVGGLGPGCGPSAPSEAPCPGPYPDPATSAYVLPWSVGQGYRVGQGNCGPGSHAAGSAVQYAYDFLMPTGTAVLAARSGTVLLVEERFADGTRRAGEENYVNVRHGDGTLAAYVHLTQGGALVEVGQPVTQGQVLGLSGDSGSSSEPHLHFHVQACEGCGTVPISFRNTRPHPRGLVQGETYQAEPF